MRFLSPHSNQADLAENSRGVSPVIGVILMVAITVILAAVIGAFVLGLGDQVQQTSPSASFSFDWDADNTLTVTHEGGQGIPAEQLYIIGHDDTEESWDELNGFESVRAGDSVDVQASSNQDIRVVWRSAGDQQSATLARFSVP